MSPQDLSNFSMMDLFRTEVETQAAVLNEGLLSLESDARSKEKLASLMRAAHSIKGAARIVALDAVVKVSHAMEDCFVAAQEGRFSSRGTASTFCCKVWIGLRGSQRFRRPRLRSGLPSIKPKQIGWPPTLRR